MTGTESAIMSKHVAYCTDLLDKDVAVAFGPVAEPSGLYGMAVVEAPDEQEVRKRLTPRFAPQVSPEQRRKRPITDDLHPVLRSGIHLSTVPIRR
jgi:hypothetical protein